MDAHILSLPAYFWILFPLAWIALAAGSILLTVRALRRVHRVEDATPYLRPVRARWVQRHAGWVMALAIPTAACAPLLLLGVEPLPYLVGLFFAVPPVLAVTVVASATHSRSVSSQAVQVAGPGISSAAPCTDGHGSSSDPLPDLGVGMMSNWTGPEEDPHNMHGAPHLIGIFREDD